MEALGFPRKGKPPGLVCKREVFLLGTLGTEFIQLVCPVSGWRCAGTPRLHRGSPQQQGGISAAFSAEPASQCVCFHLCRSTTLWCLRTSSSTEQVGVPHYVRGFCLGRSLTCPPRLASLYSLHSSCCCTITPSGLFVFWRESRQHLARCSTSAV